MGKVFGSQETKLGSQSCVEDSAIRTHVNHDRTECFIVRAVALSAEQRRREPESRIGRYFGCLSLDQDEGKMRELRVETKSYLPCFDG